MQRKLEGFSHFDNNGAKEMNELLMHKPLWEMENLKSSLLTKGETKIEGVGYFNTNGEGKLVFEPQTSSVFKDEWYGFTKIAVKAVEVKKLTPAPARVLETVADEPQVLELNESAESKVNWGKWVAAAAIVGIMCFVSFFLVNSGNFNLKSTLNPFEYNTKATDDEMKDQKEEMVAAKPAPEPINTASKPSSSNS